MPKAIFLLHHSSKLTFDIDRDPHYFFTLIPKLIWAENNFYNYFLNCHIKKWVELCIDDFSPLSLFPSLLGVIINSNQSFFRHVKVMLPGECIPCKVTTWQFSMCISEELVIIYCGNFKCCSVIFSKISFMKDNSRLNSFCILA